MNEVVRKLHERVVKEGVYPVDVNTVVEENGLDIVYFDPSLNAKSKLSNVSGMLDGAHKKIYINTNDSIERQRFTAAHELAHYLYEHSTDSYGLNYRHDGPKKTAVERKADDFAAELLMPSPLVKKVVNKYESAKPTLNEIAELFGVSLQAMRYKLDTLGLDSKVL